MLSPPDADPVMPDNRLIEKAAETKGCPAKALSKLLLIAANAASEAMVAPNPTSEAVLRVGSKHPKVPSFKVWAGFSKYLQKIMIEKATAKSSENSTDQIPMI